VDTGLFGFEESTMGKTRAAYASEFRRQMVELVRAGRSPEELAREFEPTAQSIRNRLAQCERNAGRGDGGLTTAEREELNRLRRENRQLRLEREILSKAAAWIAPQLQLPRLALLRHPRLEGTVEHPGDRALQLGSYHRCDRPALGGSGDPAHALLAVLDGPGALVN
jgi:transposase